MNPTTPKPQKYTGTIIGKETYSDKVFNYTVQLENPQTISFVPGQFVSVTVGDKITRQYSIASSPTRTNTLDLLVDIAPGGPGSLFFQNEKTGNPISFIGPMGQFTLMTEEGTIVFLATSTGVAPFKSMIEYLLEKQNAQGDAHKRTIHLYLGFRFRQNIFLQEYFEDLQEKHPNFYFHLSLSRPDDAWTGDRGYVQDQISPEVLADANARYYICGGSAMVKGTLDHLRSKNIPDDRIHFEPF